MAWPGVRAKARMAKHGDIPLVPALDPTLILRLLPRRANKKVPGPTRGPQKLRVTTDHWQQARARSYTHVVRSFTRTHERRRVLAHRQSDVTSRVVSEQGRALQAGRMTATMNARQSVRADKVCFQIDPVFLMLSYCYYPQNVLTPRPHRSTTPSHTSMLTSRSLTTTPTLLASSGTLRLLPSLAPSFCQSSTLLQALCRQQPPSQAASQSIHLGATSISAHPRVCGLRESRRKTHGHEL